MSLLEHLVVLPVVLPLATGALLLLVDERNHRLKATISLAALAALLAAAIALARRADASAMLVYAIGDWAAPFGIVLVADRLAAAMVLLSTVLGIAASAFALPRWQHMGPRFHAIVQFLLMGLNGAFLTGDLFNLFVFFELLLAASYALALHGSGTGRVRWSLHYIVINLAASLLFLVGVALIYGVVGTLNMAELALRIPGIAGADRVLVEAGAFVLAVAFLVKAGMWPLCFWLPSTYAAASAPAAALFSILSKMGFYAVLRLWLLFFAGDVGGEFLFYGGVATLVFGMIGMLASQDLGRLGGYSLLVSAGTLLVALSRADATVTGAALFYLFASTLGIAAFFLLAELVQRAREPGADLLAVTAEAFDLAPQEGEPGEEPGTVIPAAMAILGLSFACCALLVAGLPPMPGFVAKVALLSGMVASGPIDGAAWTFIALLLLSGLASVIAMGRAGVRIFWASEERTVPRIRVTEMAPVASLLALCFALTVAAGPAMRYLDAAARWLHAPQSYIDSVLPPR